MPLFGALTDTETKAANMSNDLLTTQGTMSASMLVKFVQELKREDALEAPQSEIRAAYFTELINLIESDFKTAFEDRNLRLSDAFEQLVFKLRGLRELPPPETVISIKEEA